MCGYPGVWPRRQRRRHTFTNLEDWALNKLSTMWGVDMVDQLLSTQCDTSYCSGSVCFGSCVSAMCHMETVGLNLPDHLFHVHTHTIHTHTTVESFLAKQSVIWCVADELFHHHDRRSFYRRRKASNHCAHKQLVSGSRG